MRYHVKTPTSIPMRDSDHVVIGRAPGPKTAAAMRGKGPGMTAEKLQRLSEHSRLNHKPDPIPDRVRNAGEVMQARNLAARRREWDR